VAADLTDLHHRDFHAWALHHADELRRLGETRPNAAIDFPNLVDEVENLARTEARAARSQLQRLLVHLLELEHSPAEHPRNEWLNTVDDAREQLAAHLSPTVRNLIEPELAAVYQRARRQARRELAGRGERDAADGLPSDVPYALDRLLEDGWYPRNRHGLADEV
jgi:hypothetical protein